MTIDLSGETEATKGGQREFLTLACLMADVLESYTVAILSVTNDEEALKLDSYCSSSDNINPSIIAPIKDSLIGKIFSQGSPALQNVHGDEAFRWELYKIPVKVKSYMASSIGRWGLLWADSEQKNKFTAKHLNIFLEFVEIAESIYVLKDSKAESTNRDFLTKSVNLLLKDHVKILAQDAQHLKPFLDMAISGLHLKAGISAIKKKGTDSYEVNASVGFPPAFKPGRKLRLEGGWVSKALDQAAPLTAEAHETGNTNLVVFSPYERFGFDVTRLAIVPWRGMDAEIGGFVAIVGESSAGAPGDKELLETIGKLFSVIALKEKMEAMLGKVRNYDGETGLLSESAFHGQSRVTFEAARKRGITLTLLLAEISDLGSIYLNYEPEKNRKFLELFTDRLTSLTQRPYVAGKIRSGLFGLLIEGLTKRESLGILDKASIELGSGEIMVGSERVDYGVRLSVTHYPDDAEDFNEFWVHGRPI